MNRLLPALLLSSLACAAQAAPAKAAAPKAAPTTQAAAPAAAAGDAGFVTGAAAVAAVSADAAAPGAVAAYGPLVPAPDGAAPAPTPAPASFPQAPTLDARSYILVDMTSGQILAGKNIDEQVQPASLTKMMTAYVVFDALKAKQISLSQPLPISVRAWKTPGSRMFVKPNTQVPVDDLLKGMIVQSGNDAAMALAEGVGGSLTHFVQLMNEDAQKLGMKNTHFDNPDGLPVPGHLTTARDLALLVYHLRRDFPEYMNIFAMQHYLYPGTPTSNSTNRNSLLFSDPTVNGMKTGHTQEAGYCLVATATRDFPNLSGGRSLISVVLGAPSWSLRNSNSQRLLNWGYTSWNDLQLFPADEPAATPRVWKGKSKELKLGLAGRAIVVSVPAGQAKNVKTDLVRPDPLIAPFTKGEKVATLKVTLGNDTLAEVPLVALDAVPEAGFFGRVWDGARLLVHRWTTRAPKAD